MRRTLNAALATVVILPMVLAGCNSGTASAPPTASAATTAPTATTASAATAAPTATTAATAAPATTVSKTATTQAASTTAAAPITFTMFVNHTWFWVDSFGERPIDDEITKRTGVSLKITKASDDSQLGILVASGSLPDLIYTYKKANLLTTPELCYTWPELISKYDPGFTLTPYELAVNSAADGRADGPTVVIVLPVLTKNIRRG